MKTILLTVLSIGIGVSFIACSPTERTESEGTVKIPNATQSLQLKDAKSDQFLNGEFRTGFYLYLSKSSFKQSTDPEIRDLDETLNQIADMGFNYVYLGASLDNQLFRDALKVCLERRLAVIAQIEGGAYLLPDSDIPKQIKIATKFIKKYKEHPAVISFLVKEEPVEKDMPRLQEYYEGILKEIPDAPIYLLHTSLNVAKIEPAPHPTSVGTDRYAFWWEFALNNNRATPASALKWYQSQMNGFQRFAAERDQPFEAVFTIHAAKLTYAKDSFKNALYPKSAPEEKKQEAVERIFRLADNANQGVSWSDEGNIEVWKYYRPPTNSTYAMAWLGVMEGATSVSIWSWSPTKVKESTRGISQWSGALGDGVGVAATAEFSNFAKEIRPFGRLLRAATKEGTPVKEIPAGHEIVKEQPAQNPTATIQSKDAILRTFSLPNLNGKLVIPVNTKVGEWSDGKSPYTLKDEDPFHIDANGNLLDYKPYFIPREVTLAVDKSYNKVINLLTGESQTPDEKGEVSFNVLPGRGAILFLTTEGSNELDTLIDTYNIPDIRSKLTTLDFEYNEENLPPTNKAIKG